MITEKDFNANKNNKKENTFKVFLFNMLIKTLIVIILLLGSLIYIKQSDKNKENFEKVVLNNSLSFAKLYDLYQKYIGEVIPFKKDNKKTSMVSKDKIIYKDIKQEGNGYVLDVSSNYLVQALHGGIVTSIVDDDYNKQITIQDKRGINITYGLITNTDVKIYDYINSGEIIGTADKKLFLSFIKNGKSLSYDEFI